MRRAAKAPHAEGDQHGAERRVGRQEDDGDGEQGARDSLAAQHPQAFGQVGADGADRGSHPAGLAVLAVMLRVPGGPVRDLVMGRWAGSPPVRAVSAIATAEAR